MKYEILQMLRQGEGAIVNTASAGGVIGMEGLSAYIASRASVISLTKTAAFEYATAGIRVNVVCPGSVLTPRLEHLPDAEKVMAPLQPMQRVGRPEEIAGAVLRLCSDVASYITGHPLVVDGGMVAQGWRSIWGQVSQHDAAANFESRGPEGS